MLTNLLKAAVFLFAFSLIFSCTDPAEEDLKNDLLIGKWSITSVKVEELDASDNVVQTSTQTATHNMLTIEFKSSGSFLYIDVEEAEWDDGTFSYDGKESLTINFDEPENAKVLSLTETSLKIEVMDDSNSGRERMTFEATKNSGSEAMFVTADIIGKWRLTSFSNQQFIDLDDDEEYENNEKILDISAGTIDVNRYTITYKENGSTLLIDNLIQGAYSDEGDYEILDNSNLVLINGSSQNLLHVTSNSGGTITFKSIEYGEEEVQGSMYDAKYTGQITAIKHTGGEPSITNAELFGSWEITAFAEYADGVNTTTPEESPVGSTLNLNSNGTGSLVFPDLSSQTLSNVVYIDANTFAFDISENSETNTILLTVESYTSSSKTLKVISGELSPEYDSGTNTIQLVQREVYITCVKK